MSKRANVRLGWKKSVSSKIASVRVVMDVDGVRTETTVGPEVEEQIIKVNAFGSVHFFVEVTNTDGLKTVSLTHDFVLGDLEAPQPATDLFHEVISVEDVPDSPPTP